MRYVLIQLVDKYKSKTKGGLKNLPSGIEAYSEKDAQVNFKKDLVAIYEKLGKKSILLIFDEIERITINTATVEHWKKGLDSVFFWECMKSTLTSLNQADKSIFSFMIVGTNPTCIESRKIQEEDNPIFESVSVDYLEQFDVAETREMLKKLGNFMGVQFEDVIYGKLVEDYGGHPFLTRQLCSVIYQQNKGDIPIKINRKKYNKAKSSFNQDKGIRYMNLILSVLTDFYKDEYTMLQWLAKGDNDFFNSLAKESPSDVAHLEGYGIISYSESDREYDFRMDAIQEFLQNKYRYNISESDEENKQKSRHREAAQRINDVELKLRDIIRRLILGAYRTTEKSKIVVWKTLSTRNKGKDCATYTYKELFYSVDLKIFFSDLRIIIEDDWEIFQEVFEGQKQRFKDSMQIVNGCRNRAYHSKSLTEKEFTDFRENIKWLETCLANWDREVG